MAAESSPTARPPLRAVPEAPERSDRRTLLDDMRMEIRVANLEGLRLANEMRVYGRRLAYVGVRDDSHEAHQIGVELEARGNRYIRQRPSAK